MILTRPLPKELQEIAKNQLNEDPEKIIQFLALLKDWIAKTPHLKARTDDQFLLSFLRSCKFNIERTKSKLDGFYTIHTAMPDIFFNRKMDERLLYLLKLKAFVPLPTPDANGNRVVLVRHIPYYETNTTVYEAVKVAWMFDDIFLNEDDNAVVSGLFYVIDLAKFNLKDAPSFNPISIKKISNARKLGNPLRLKGLHFFNTHPYCTPIFKIACSFYGEKISSRVSLFKI